MGGIDVLSHEEDYMRRLLEDDVGQQRAAVLLGVGLGGKVFDGHILLRQREQAAQGDDTLGDEVNTVDKTDGRHLLVGEVEARLELASGASGNDLRSSTTTNDTLVGVAHKLVHIFFILLLIHRRPHHDVHHGAGTHADGCHGGVVTRAVEVEVVAGGSQETGGSTRRHVGVDVVVEVLHDFLALPAEVEHLSDAGMDGSVAHHKNHIALVEFQLGDENALVKDCHLGAREVAGVAMMVPDSLGVVKFKEVSPTLVVDVNDGESAVRHPALFAYRERLDDGAHTILDVCTSSHHGA